MAPPTQITDAFADPTVITQYTQYMNGSGGFYSASARSLASPSHSSPTQLSRHPSQPPRPSAPADTFQV